MLLTVLVGKSGFPHASSCEHPSDIPGSDGISNPKVFPLLLHHNSDANLSKKNRFICHTHPNNIRSGPYQCAS